MREITVKLKVSNNQDSDEEVVQAVNNAIGFADNDGMWPYKYYVEVETI